MRERCAEVPQSTPVWGEVRERALTGRCGSMCYIEAIQGEFAYDDGAAIVKNKDVNGNNSNAYTEIWSHDFWGQDLRNEVGAVPTLPTAPSYRSLPTAP